MAPEAAQFAGAAVGAEAPYECESGATTDMHSSTDHGRRAHAQQRTECITAQFLERGGFFNMPIEARQPSHRPAACSGLSDSVPQSPCLLGPYRSRQKDQRLLQQIAKLEAEPDMVIVLGLLVSCQETDLLAGATIEPAGKCLSSTSSVLCAGPVSGSRLCERSVTWPAFPD